MIYRERELHMIEKSSQAVLKFAGALYNCYLNICFVCSLFTAEEVKRLEQLKLQAKYTARIFVREFRKFPSQQRGCLYHTILRS